MTYTFAGDDLRAEIEGELGDGTRFVAERRQVDGELYFGTPAPGLGRCGSTTSTPTA